MIRQLNFLFIILVVIVFAYLLAPDKEYTNRIWVQKGISVTAPYRAAVEEYWRKKQVLPGTGDLELEKILVRADIEKTAVDSITVGKNGPGSITVHYSVKNHKSVPEELNNTEIILVPVPTVDKLVWACKGTMPDSMIPQVCKKM